MEQDQREIRRKLRILEHARKTGNIIKPCRYFGVSRSTFYLWKRAAAAAQPAAVEFGFPAGAAERDLRVGIGEVQFFLAET